MRIRLAMSLRIPALALLATLAVANAQTSSLSKLILRAESLKQPAQPGTLAQDQTTPNSTSQNGVHIAILKGDHGVNVLKTKTAVTPLVEVRDANEQPMPGVSVTFTSPNDGPSVTFMNGSRSITVTTDPGGQASAIGMKPVNQGRFQIAVSASQETQTVMTAISMSNVATERDAVSGTGASKPGLSKGVIFALVGAAAAAAVGVGVGLGGKGSSSSSSGGGGGSSSSSATIGLGSSGVTAGAPH